MWALDTRCALLTASADGFIAGLADIDRQRVSRFRLEKDRLHSLVSILLQRRLIRSTFNVEDSQYSILRTSENKPYLCLGDRNGDRGSWNFNVSHHGHFVCICSHPTALIGVDIVEIKMRSSWTRGVPAYIGMFQGKQFSAREISNMLQQRDPLVHFFINWSMKESFIKAVGTGLYFDLVSVEFMISYDECYTGSELITGTAQLSINGVPRLDWELVFRSLDHAHIISVATGPLADAADSYRHAILPHAKLHGSTFRVCAFDEKCSSSPDSNNHTSFLEFLTTSQLNQ